MIVIISILDIVKEQWCNCGDSKGIYSKGKKKLKTWSISGKMEPLIQNKRAQNQI